jgi:phosphatidylglycerophosphatase C
MKLYLFDFDGTLTKQDSMWKMLWFSQSWPQFLIKMTRVSFRFVGLFFSKKWSNEIAKMELLSIFFKGKTRVELEKMGRDFSKKIIPQILRPDIFEIAKNAQKAGNFVAIVSASCDFWLEPFCETHGFELICTKLEYVGGRFSGRFSGKNCNNFEKVERIRAHFDLADFDEILAWGNSAGDAEMLKLAHQKFMVV